MASKHIVINEIWIQNRFRIRKRMTGKLLYKDPESGFMVTRTSGGFTAEKKKTFLLRFKVCSNVTQIAKSIGLGLPTIYDHLAMDSKFREEYLQLDQIENKAKQLNNALKDVTKIEEQQFLSEMLSKSIKYKT